MFKKFFVVSLFFVFSSAFAEIPRCDENVWRIGGYIFFTGGENCTDRVAACSFIGTKSEGWYSYPKNKERLLGYTICKNDFEDGYTPTCEKIGTKSEGWYVAGNLVAWSKCSTEEAACVHQGTRSEGWYSFPKNTRHRIILDFCSEDI